VGCQNQPTSTLVYDYAQSMVTLSPLSPAHEPSSYDLCFEHARNLQVPTGWRLERVDVPPPAEVANPGWLTSLADEVRQIGWRDEQPTTRGEVVELTRRGHLRVITDATEAR